LVFKLSVQCGVEGCVSGLLLSKRPGTHFTGGWVGPRAGSGKYRHLRESIPKTVDPVASHIPTTLSRPIARAGLLETVHLCGSVNSVIVNEVKIASSCEILLSLMLIKVRLPWSQCSDCSIFPQFIIFIITLK
jgi:hypothetical protein